MAELSPDAKAVLLAQARQRCAFEWSTVNDPPCHPSDADWNGCIQCIDRLGTAAALRAAVEANLPEEPKRPYRTDRLRDERQRLRREFLALADELEQEQ